MRCKLQRSYASKSISETHYVSAILYMQGFSFIFHFKTTTQPQRLPLGHQLHLISCVKVGHFLSFQLLPDSLLKCIGFRGWIAVHAKPVNVKPNTLKYIVDTDFVFLQMMQMIRDRFKALHSYNAMRRAIFVQIHSLLTLCRWWSRDCGRL